MDREERSMNNIIRGRVWKFGHDIDTDIIAPAIYLNKYLSPKESALHAMEPIDPDFSKKVKPGDIIVAGENFGCGSSREEAAVNLKALELGAVIASSFGRIFYRNCINVGLPALYCPDLTAKVNEGDHLEIDLQKGLIQNLTTEENFTAEPMPEIIMSILACGGLEGYLQKGSGISNT